MSGSFRPSWVEIDVDAMEHNAHVLTEMVAPASLCAVVKADGYGHGSVDASRAALAGGATLLAVALVEEAVVLREAGMTAPILILSEPPIDAFEQVVRLGLTTTIYTAPAVAALRKVAGSIGGAPVRVHVKVDTGMHRVGCESDEAVDLARSIASAPELTFEGLWSHLSVADDLSDHFTEIQQDRLLAVRDALLADGLSPIVTHLANSAGAIAHPLTRFDIVRCGIALYGYLPSELLLASFQLQVSPEMMLQPAMSLHSRVHAVRELAAGERPSYGRVYELHKASRIATVPIGYADGVPRALQHAGGEVLIGGVRRPFAGTVTMDQVMIDCGDDDVRPGDEVVLLGRQGDEEILASEWAELLGTISYEVLCGIGQRVPRVVVRNSENR